jgi:hypothetical protein
MMMSVVIVVIVTIVTIAKAYTIGGYYSIVEARYGHNK